MLIHHGAVSAILDLDHLPIGPRIRDLSYYLSSLLERRLDHGQDRGLELLPHYVEGFSGVVAIEPRERAAVVPMMVVIMIGMGTWRLGGHHPDPAAYERALRTLHLLLAHLPG